MARIAILTAALLVWLTPASSRATFHTSLISEVMSGVNGDPTVQYVEIRVSAGTASGVKGSVLTAFDCTGMSHVVLLTVPDNVANGGADVHWLMATTNFAAAAGITPDFTWDAVKGSMDPTCGMVCWGAPGVTPPDPSTWDAGDPNKYVDCVGYGGYAGPTKTSTHDGTPPSGIPTGLSPGDGTSSLTRMTFTGSNLADFALASPTPTNNAGNVGVFRTGTTTTTVMGATTTTEMVTTTTELATSTTSASTTSTSTAPRPTVTLTTTSSSTTTVPPGSPCTFACDDGDACSVDRCVAGSGCVHELVAAPTDLERLGPACTGQPVPSSVGQQFVRGCGLIELAKAQPAKKANTSLTKAVRALKRASKLADRARTRKKGPISADCAAALRTVVGGARDQALREKSAR